MPSVRIAAVAMLSLLLVGAGWQYRHEVALLMPGAEAKRELSAAMPIGDVHRLLAQTGMPPNVFDVEGVDVEVVASNPTAVSWVLKDGDSESMRFVAALRPLSDRDTGVTLTLRGSQGGRFGDVAKRLDDQPSIKALYLAAMGEQIAAMLEQRPYRASVTYAATAVAVAANMQGLAKGMEEAGRAAHLKDKATLAKAYADEAAGRLPLPAPRPAR